MSDAVKLYTDDSGIVDTNVHLGHWHAIKLDSEASFREFFEVNRIATWIGDHSYKRTALQLPDGLLRHAYKLSAALEAECAGLKIFILADTSYRSCCIDDVAAQHAQCDSLVHFGEACLSQSSERIPVLYSFGRHTLDLDAFRAHVGEYIRSTNLDNSKICLVYDAIFAHCSDQIKDVLAAALPPNCTLSTCDIVQGARNDEHCNLGRSSPSNDEGQKLFFVGVESSELLSIWLMTFPHFDEYVHFAPESNKLEHDQSTSHRQLKRRMFLIERLKDANVVGLVIGTLEIRGYRDAVDRVRRLCNAAGKKLYVFSIGKLNEAKLSNFAADIDAFILLSCPFGVVLDSVDFYKPLVNLFEAEIALNPGKQWFAGAGWTAEFNTLLNDEIGESRADESDVSLVTGRIRATQAATEEDDADVAADGSTAKQLIQYTAGDYFAQRSWKGLDDAHEANSDMKLKEGLKGLSLSYTTTIADSKQ